MNANELADELSKQTGGAGNIQQQAATMLRQQQAEIDALKQIIDANNLNQNIGQFVKPTNEPVAWARQDGVIAFHKQKELDSQGYKWFPLYTHPVKEQDESFDRTASHRAGEYVSYPVKEQDTDCQYCKQGCIRCDARKQLTDEEINNLWAESHEDGIAMQQGFTTQQHYFAHLILRKAHEK